MMLGQSYSTLNSLDLQPLGCYHPMLERLTALSYRSGDLGNYLNEIVQGVSRLIQSDWTIVTLCEGEMGQLIASSLDLREDETVFSVHGTLANEVIRSGRPFIITDDCQTWWQQKLPQEYRGYLGVPMRTPGGEVIGTICSFLREVRLFTESEVKVVELFAERAAIAIENFRLYQQQLKSNQRLFQEVTTCSMELKLHQEKLIERERLAAIGEFAAMIVHEVRNPMTVIEMGLSYAKKKLLSSDQERLDLSLDESRRLKHLLNEILLYAKPQVLNLSRVNFTDFLTNLLLQLQELPAGKDRHIKLTNTLSEVEVLADTDKLKQVFTNLVQNAFEAIAPNETVDCKILNATNPEQVCVQIHNGGDPIPPEILPRLTTPFCSTKSSGTGLGLAIAKRIVTEHGGELWIKSSTSGTTVGVQLQIASLSPAKN